MASREASLRVTIRNAGFLAGMRQMTQTAVTTGQRIGAALSGPMKAGLASAAGTMKSMMGTLAGHMKTAATLGGAFAIGKFISDAVAMQTVYRNLAHDLGKMDPKLKDWKNVQALIAPLAEKTGQNVQDIAIGFEKVFGSTGDVEYTKKVMEAVGTVATATGKDVGQWGEVAQMAYRKFGVSVEEIPDLLARVDNQLGIGGASLETIKADFGEMATEAQNAGFKGAEGMVQLAALMRQVDNEVGEKATPALKQMFEMIKWGTAQSQALQKNGRIKFTADMTAMDKIRETLKSVEGRKAAELVFTGDARRVYDSLVKPFDKAMQNAKAQGASAKDATQAGLKAFDDALSNMALKGQTYADLQDEAKKRMEQDPSMVLKNALNKMAVAFQDERMMSAIEKLAKALPPLADGFVKLVDWVMKNPLLAAGGYVGAKIGLSFAQGALVDAGTKLGATASGWLQRTAPTAGAKLGLAAKLALVAAAAYIGFEIGKRIANAFWDEREQLDKGAQSADIGAFNALSSKDAGQQKAALEQVRSQIAAIEESRSGMLGGLKQFYHDASAAGAYVATGGEVGYTDTQADNLAKLKRAQADLEAALKKTGQAQDKGAGAADRSAQAMDRLAASADRLDAALGKVGSPAGAPGGKGPPGSLYTGPGYAQ